MKSKKLSLIIALVLCLALVMTACGSGSTSSKETSSAALSQTEQKEATKETPKEKVKIKFYGKIVEYASGEPMCNALAEEMKDQYDFDFIQVDWGNLDKVIRTGIASGEPADVYCYWPQNMKSFIDSSMALDLTPYLEANGGEWKKQFIPASLETGNFGGKYYAVPMESNFATIVANADLFAKAGVTIPDKWNWDEFLAACKELKDKVGVIPFGNGMDNGRGDWIIRNAMLSLAKSENRLADYAAAKIPATDPLYKTALTNI
jgi:ABC-type glycerol-3-phosphate transport system substrate-binding protein